MQLQSALHTGKTPGELFAFSIFRPLKMLVSPIVFLLSVYAATVYSYAYLCFTTFPRVFEDQYGFGSGASGDTRMSAGEQEIYAQQGFPVRGPFGWTQWVPSPSTYYS